MTQDILDTISHCRIFSSADPETLRLALDGSDCFEACFDAGETIRSPEESERRVGVILSGRAKVRSAHESKSVLLKTLEEGELFGVANLFENSAGYVSLIVAEKECRVFFIGQRTVSRLLESDRGFLHAYIEFLSSRIRFLNRKITFYTSGSAERRLAMYLASFKCERVEPDMPLNSLCEMLDVGRASLYRAIDRLIEEGFVERDGSAFILLDREKMLKKYKI